MTILSSVQQKMNRWSVYVTGQKIYKLFKKALSKGFSINKYKTISSDRMYSGMQKGRN